MASQEKDLPQSYKPVLEAPEVIELFGRTTCINKQHCLD